MKPQTILVLITSFLLQTIQLDAQALLPSFDKKVLLINDINEDSHTLKIESDSLYYFHDVARIKRQLNGMKVLGTWAGVNIGTGLIMRNNTSGADSYFHEMNAIWNTVNLAIAASGYFKTRKETPNSLGFAVLDRQLKLEKSLLVNSGIDLAYIMTGFYLQERAFNSNGDNNRDRFLGYGRSMVLQGLFLLVYDSLFYAIEANASSNLRQVMNSMYFSPAGIGYIKTF